MSNEAVVTPGSTPAAAAGLSPLGRIANTFIAPSATFRDILRSCAWYSWIPPFLLMLVFGLGQAYTVSQQVGFDRVYQNTLHSSPASEDRINNMPADQKARAITLGAAFTKYAAFGVPVTIVFFFALYSLMLWGSFNFGLGAQTDFWQVYAVTFYAALPYVVRDLLIILTVSFGGNGEAFEYKNPIGTNPGYYLPDAPGWLRALLGSIDLIQLWSLLLVIIGMSIIAKKSFTQSALICGTFWALLVLAQVVGGIFNG